MVQLFPCMATVMIGIEIYPVKTAIEVNRRRSFITSLDKLHPANRFGQDVTGYLGVSLIRLLYADFDQAWHWMKYWSFPGRFSLMRQCPNVLIRIT